jgi:hypothetical protein
MSTLRGGFDRGLGGSAEATAGQQYAALAQAAAELARAWAQAAMYVEPDPLNYPGRYSAFHYAMLAAGGSWFRGPGVPSPLLGENGNYYLDELTGDLYQKVTGSWVLALNIKGPGVPTGGQADYVLVKKTNDSMDTEWRKAGVPAGGLYQNVLAKLSDADGDYGWAQLWGGGGLTGQILIKASDTWWDYTFIDAASLGGGGGGEFYFQSGSIDGIPTAIAAGARWIDSDSGIMYTWVNDGDSAAWVEFGPSRMTPVSNTPPTKVIQAAASDLITPVAAGTNKAVFRAPFDMVVTEVRASLATAQTSGSIFTVDINVNGSSILSTKLTIDNGEKTSTTATTPAVISTPAVSSDAEITVDVDQVGDGTAKGLVITLIGT